ncbi:MAG: hypothetical protein HOL65_00415 [Microbacteriaceae bacterium]|jgi:hypothetical protein|nr:hypothetical protein [Microbacteriaceae bacterium]MBT5247241.1 hypothetical protein [Microbacteriaceae bacterium]
MNEMLRKLFQRGFDLVSQSPRSLTVFTLGLVAMVVAGGVVTAIAPERQPPILTLAGMSAEDAQALAQESSLYVEFDYQVGQSLSDARGVGPVYRLELAGDPLDLLVSLGRTFDVSGTPQKSEYFDQQWPGYVLGPQDWSGPSLTLNWKGTGSWYYSDPSAYQDPVCEEVLDESSPEGVTFECENPSAGEALTAPEQARSFAAETFGATGFPITSEDIHVLVNDEWGIGVSASVEVEGFPTALEWTMFWAPGPILASVSGHAGVPVKVGDFATMSPRGAVERLGSSIWWGSVAAEYYTEEGSEHAHDDLDYLAEAEGLMAQPGEVIEVIVNDSEPTVVMVWDSDGTAWIVPGYLMRFGEDIWDSAAVVSLSDQAINIAPPVSVDLMDPERER